uniref:NADH dehydrogenase subunit 6 n=1 Tax=Hyalella cajasi TaxID=2759775 RepID=A0A7T8V6W0_9CRUS|nr:NADH dehydrogenase subunit 6 [Hyalella cajasi]
MLSATLSLCLTTVFLFSQMSSPLGMGAVVIIFSFFISLSMSLICTTSWFSLLLFMLFLSGMMIIFMYVCSLASNEAHYYSFGAVYAVLGLLMLSLIGSETSKATAVSGLLSIEAKSSFLMYKIYSFSVYLFAVVLIIYLLITLIAVVKISVVSEGPVRTKK